MIEKLESGSLSRDEAQAFRYVYPDLHEQVVEHAQQQILDSKEQGKFMPVEKIAQLGLLLGAPIDTILEPEYIGEVQMALHMPPPNAEKDVQPQQPQGMIDSNQIAATGLLTPIDKAVM